VRSTLRLFKGLLPHRSLSIPHPLSCVFREHLLDLKGLGLEIWLLKDLSSLEDESRRDEVLVADAEDRFKLNDLQELLILTLQTD
jgi:hypothetical protein